MKVTVIKKLPPEPVYRLCDLPVGSFIQTADFTVWYGLDAHYLIKLGGAPGNIEHVPRQSMSNVTSSYPPFKGTITLEVM